MWLDELRNAARHLRRARRFTLACVLTLAFALTASATLLNVLEAIVFRQLAVPDPDRLLGFYPTTGDFSDGFSASELQGLAERQDVLSGICGVTAGYGTLGVNIGDGPARQRPVEAITGNCYTLLGVRASLGRLLESGDGPLTDDPGHVAVISHRLWRESFGSAADVLGRTIRLEGTPLTVVGVLPDSYHGLNADEAPDLAVPLTLPWTLQLQPPRAMHAVGRLRPDKTLAEASVQLTAIWPDVLTKTTQRASAAPVSTLRIQPLANGFSTLRELYWRPLSALAGLAACLLLLACVNVGGLSVARLLDRREAFAVQLALGAGRGRLAVQLLAEAVLIGAAAVLLSIPLAQLASQVVAGALWTGERPMTLRATPLTVTVVLTAVVGLLASLVVAAPGWIALTGPGWALDARSVGHAGRRGHRRGVMAVQIALGFALTFAAVLFISDLLALQRLPLGYAPDRLTWVRMDRTSRLTSAPSIGYLDVVLARLEAIPGVSLAAASQSFGTTGNREDTSEVRVAGGTNQVEAIMDRVSPSFFRAAAIPLHQGRGFIWSDVAGAQTVTILNRSLADRLFSDGNAVGRTVALGARRQLATVVGVVADVTPGDPRLQNVPQYYLPLSADTPPAPVILLRHDGRTLTLAELTSIIEPPGHHTVLRVSAMAAQANRFLAREALLSSATGLFAALALVVSLAGLYATIEGDMIRRRREIGIRVAVGATPAMVRQLVFVELGWVLSIGLGLGLPVALAGAYGARRLLSPGELGLFPLLLGTGLAITGAALLVSAVPAQRATRTTMVTALRSD